MRKSENDKKTAVSLAVAILPPIIVAIAGIIGSVLSYKSATQTAEEKQMLNTFAADVPIAISAKQGWQSTGVIVNMGDKVDISVVKGGLDNQARLTP